MIYSVLDACQFVLEDQGEPQSAFWLASLIMEMKLWRATEAGVQAALVRDIQKFEQSRFVRVGADQFGLREWRNP